MLARRSSLDYTLYCNKLMSLQQCVAKPEDYMAEIYDSNDWDRQVIEEFRANGGKVGGPLASAPLLLLTTTGAKSGKPRTRPLVYLSEEGRIYVFAGNRGAPTNPAWYHNLLAHPDVTVELGTEKFAARAIVVDSAEGERLGRIQLQKIPALAELSEKITRKVPAVLLERKE
jgi:deazaflavin-dependent oxidoreductase (nitroreductase family)